MSISDKLKNTLNKLSPHLGNLHFGTVLAGISAQGDTADATAAKLAEMQSYSETPQRIGTWIDGTPIYRIAFAKKIADLCETKTDFDAVISNGYISLGSVLNDYISGTGEGFSIIASAFVYRPFAAPCATDDIPLNIINDGAWINLDVGLASSIIDYLGNITYEGLSDEAIYGWIEFAMPESDIETG